MYYISSINFIGESAMSVIFTKDLHGMTEQQLIGVYIGAKGSIGHILTEIDATLNNKDADNCPYKTFNDTELLSRRLYEIHGYTNTIRNALEVLYSANIPTDNNGTPYWKE